MREKQEMFRLFGSSISERLRDFDSMAHEAHHIRIYLVILHLAFAGFDPCANGIDAGLCFLYDAVRVEIEDGRDTERCQDVEAEDDIVQLIRQTLAPDVLKGRKQCGHFFF